MSTPPPNPRFLQMMMPTHWAWRNTLPPAFSQIAPPTPENYYLTECHHDPLLSYFDKLAAYTTQLKDHKLRRAQADLAIRRASIQETEIYFHYNTITDILSNSDIPLLPLFGLRLTLSLPFSIP